MCQYIEQVIFPYTEGYPCALLVDSYAAHFAPDVLEVADGHNVMLIKVPEGATAELQPLDVSFNSLFKMNRHRLLRNAILAAPEQNSSVEKTRSVVLRAYQAYQEVDAATVRRGWDPVLAPLDKPSVSPEY